MTKEIKSNEYKDISRIMKMKLNQPEFIENNNKNIINVELLNELFSTNEINIMIKYKLIKTIYQRYNKEWIKDICINVKEYNLNK